MSYFLPPYRIAIVETDAHAVQASNIVFSENKKWEILYTKSLWESCFIAMNCGLHAVLCNDVLDEFDVNLAVFDHIRFYACRKFPVPYILLKTMNEKENCYPFRKLIKSAGITHNIKRELAAIESEISDHKSAYYKYCEFQYLCFSKGQYDQPGEVLLKEISKNNLFYGYIWTFYKENKLDNCEILLSEAIINKPHNVFLHAIKSLLYYKQNQIELARKSLNPLLQSNTENPLLLYLIFTLADEFKDEEVQYSILSVLQEKFSNTLLSQLCCAIWNSRIGQLDLAFFQFLEYLEKTPQDLVAAFELSKILEQKQYPGLLSGVVNYSNSLSIRTNFRINYNQLYSF